MKINSENTNLNLRHLRTIHAIWREGSFSRAAAHLGVVPSVLTEAVKQIETIVGAALFDRRSRPVQPTPLGLEFLQETLPLVEGLDRALERLRGSADLARGTLRIGASPSVIASHVAPAIDIFRRDHPNVSVTLHDDIAERLALQVAEGGLDLAIAGSAGAFVELEQVEIGRDRFGLACRTDHKLAGLPRALRLADIRPEELIHLDRNTGTAQLLNAYEGLPEQLRSGNLHAYSTIAQLCLIRAGVGIGLLPRGAVNVIRDPDLTFIEIEDLPLFRRVSLLQPSRRPISHIAERFVAILQSIKGDRLLLP